MDENTQQNTQQIDTSRSDRDKQSRKVDDEADLLCRLFPSSSSAFKAVELVLECTPDFIHINHDQDDPKSTYSTTAKAQSRDSDNDECLPAAPKTPKNYPDIALRMSSNVRDLRMGFVFGRNPKKCDIVISRDSKRLSAAHFRIFINHNGLLMLEDMSTNGTMVDKTMLRGMKPDSDQRDLPATRILDNGSIVELPLVSERNQEWMRFIVLIPKRDSGHAEYERNLTEYLERIQQVQRQAEIARRANIPVPLPQTMPFAPLQKTARKESPTRSSIVAARGQNDYGMKWNGGDKYNVVGYIGSGAFAMVYKISTVHHGEVYACKQIEKRRYIKNGQPGKHMHNELGIMKRISHPNIVQFVESHETDRYIFIIMEFVSLGDLTVYTGEDRVMHEHMGQQVAAQIGQALFYLHGQDVVHRDVKPDNILIANHNPYVFKLSDFGLSKVVTKEDYMKTFCGTILYCAPEIYPSYKRAMAGILYGKRGRHLDHPPEETQPYKCSVDVWGIAAVLFHLLSGHPPWTGTVEDNGSVMLAKIISSTPDWEKLTLAGVSRLAIDFLRRMLQIFPDKRATDEQVLAHRWIRHIVAGDSDGDDPAGNSQKGKERSENDPVQDEEDLPDASQLDINDKKGLQGSNNIFKEAEHRHMTDENMTNLDPIEAIEANELWQRWDPGSTMISKGVLRPAIPRPQTQQPRPIAQANTRLFGEIPESALQSSGLLGQNANKALDIQDSRMEDREHYSDRDSLSLEQEDINGHEDEDISSFNEEELDGLEGEDMNDLSEKIAHGLQEENMTGLEEQKKEEEEMDKSEDEEEQEELVSTDPHYSASRSVRRAAAHAKAMDPIPKDFASVAPGHRRPNRSSASQTHAVDQNDGNLQHFQIHSHRPSSSKALSLQATEDLVDDLNMVSPDAGLSEASERPSKAATPELLARSEGHTSTTHSHSKRSSQHLHSESQEARSKRSRTSGPSRHSPRGLNSRSRASELNNISTIPNSPDRPSHHRELSDADLSSSEDEYEVSKTVSRPYRIRTDPTELFIAAELHQEWKKTHPDQADHSAALLVEPHTKPPLDPSSSSPKNNNNNNTTNTTNDNNHLPPAPAAGPNLTTPPTNPPPSLNLNPRLPHPIGHLRPTPTSIPTLPSIPLQARSITFGRAPHLNTHPHPGNPSTPNWTRVGRNALDLTLWYPGLEAQLATSTLPADWHANPELRCLISTRTSRYILVNGVRLERGVGEWRYGVLRTGDRVTVVAPDLAREAASETERMELVFVCEFSLGVSAVPRKGDGSEPFVVVRSEKGGEFERAKSRSLLQDSSVANATASGVNDERGPLERMEGEGRKAAVLR